MALNVRKSIEGATSWADDAQGRVSTNGGGTSPARVRGTCVAGRGIQWGEEIVVRAECIMPMWGHHRQRVGPSAVKRMRATAAIFTPRRATRATGLRALDAAAREFAVPADGAGNRALFMRAEAAPGAQSAANMRAEAFGTSAGRSRGAEGACLLRRRTRGRCSCLAEPRKAQRVRCGSQHMRRGAWGWGDGDGVHGRPERFRCVGRCQMIPRAVPNSRPRIHSSGIEGRCGTCTAVP